MSEPMLLKNGSGKTFATAYMIEDSHGDLVDIEYKCSYCVYQQDLDAGEWMPAYQWPDYDVVCACGEIINESRNT